MFLIFDFLIWFLGVNWCFRFDYVIVDNNIGGIYIIRLIVRVYSDVVFSINEFIINIGNEWVIVEIDFFVVNNMKVG